MPFEWDDTPEQQAAHFECVRLDEKIANIERDYDAAYAEAWRPFRARLYAQEEAAYAPPRVDDPPLRTIAEYCKMLKDANIHCGRYDILKAYEKTYDSRSPMQKKLFAIYFAAWSEYQFKLENQDGKMLSFSAPSTIGILLDASNINFFALAPNGCFTFAGTSIIGKRPTVPLNAQGVGTGMLLQRAISFFFHGPTAMRDREASHLCNTRWCLRASHIMPEFAAKNASRSKCFGSGNCAHEIKCIRTFNDNEQ